MVYTSIIKLRICGLLSGDLMTRLLFCIALSFVISVDSYGQAAKASPSPSPDNTKKEAAIDPADTAGAKPTPDPTPAIRRWLDFDSISIAARYRFIKNENGVIANNQAQYQFMSRGKFRFDEKGRYAIGFGVLTGANFSFGWNSTGWGTGVPHPDINFRQLYFEATPVDGFTFQVGSLGFNRGENTEATSYDNDGYVVGERISVRRSKTLYFDEISATNGYVGDILQPNVFRRFHRLAESNYHQVLFRKQVNKMVGYSFDFTNDSGVDTLRQAVKFAFPKSSVLDTLIFENYERLHPSPGYGVNVYGQKKLNKYFSLGGGFARIDRTMLNGDRFPRGNRLYVNGIVNFSREFTLTTSFTNGVGPIRPTLARTRLDVVFTYNVLETLRRKKLL